MGENPHAPLVPPILAYVRRLISLSLNESGVRVETSDLLPCSFLAFLQGYILSRRAPGRSSLQPHKK